MFRKILIANRGEIAVRLIRTCRALGVRAAVVYSEADRDALHLRLADEALPIGPAPPAESYLNADRILEAAKACGAEAVHPGYGFLSERAAFAAACEEAGLVFIGPSPETLRWAGDKIASREAAARAGVPVIPAAGEAGPEDGDALAREADRLGYPLLVKAAAGGGGRGMRRVEEAAGLEEGFRAARAEARMAFGDDRVYLEALLPSPRHVEVQILGDGRGAAIHLGDRECSLQRRHQKVIEESPAPGLPDDVRAGMREAALRLVRQVRYRGAGTVEFLLEGAGGFRFLEVNARLQVEHPVTEMVTGLDLAALQLRVAAGEGLPLAQEEVRFSGHAIEARLYAEDPARGFLPQIGRIDALHLPGGSGVRVDAGVAAGSEVGAEYDPLLAKIIAWGESRTTAADRLSGALAELQISGPRTNQAFLAAVAAHPAFRAGEISTGFLAENPGLREGRPPEEGLDDARLAAALAIHLDGGGGGGGAGEGEGARDAQGAGGPPGGADPWSRPGGWIPGGLE
ncbi:MAG: biotin carboxylase N-terminal domain-containing protein [bacterium]